SRWLGSGSRFSRSLERWADLGSRVGCFIHRATDYEQSSIDGEELSYYSAHCLGYQGSPNPTARNCRHECGCFHARKPEERGQSLNCKQKRLPNVVSPAKPLCG